MGGTVNTTPALIVGAVITLLCCLPGGLFTIYSASQAKNMATAGDVAGAKSKLQTAYIVGAISAVLGLIINVFYLAAQS